jgi:MoaA/NifB/PqqE/SkfB family radical SAM enzyme
MNARQKLVALARIVEIRLLGRRRPLVVTWPITDRCNFSCSYCERGRGGSRELSTDEVRRILDQLFGLGCVRVSLSGGEPLVRDDIGEIVGHARRRGMSVVMTTNGSLVPERLAAIAGVNLVKLSLEGEERVHDSLRGAGSFLRVMDAARALDAAGRRFTFNTVLNVRNLDQHEALIRTAERFGTGIRFTTINTAHAGSGTIAPLVPAPRAAYLDAVDAITVARRSGRPVSNSLAGLHHLRTWPEGRSGLRCFAGRGFAHLSAAGRLYPCIAMEGKVAGIDVLERGLREALDGLPPPACDGCWCGGTMELNLLLGGDPAAIVNARRLS